MSNSLAGVDLPSIHVIDSHTGGEPTRVVVDGFPQLRGETLSERAVDLAARYRRLATELVDEPRGNEAMVAALLTEPVDERCAAGVIFFDRALVLGMCGHGMIGLVETLRWLGRLGPGEHLVETPVGRHSRDARRGPPRVARQRGQPASRTRSVDRRPLGRSRRRGHRLRRQHVLPRR